MSEDFNPFDVSKYVDVPTTFDVIVSQVYRTAPTNQPVISRSTGQPFTDKDGKTVMDTHEKLRIFVQSASTGKEWELKRDGYNLPQPGETLNKRSDFGKLLAQLAEAGVTLSNENDLKGKTLTLMFIDVPNKKDPTKPYQEVRIVGAPQGGSRIGAALGTPTPTLSDEVAAKIATALNGVKNDTAALASKVAQMRDPEVTKLVMGGKAVPELITKGLLREEAGILVKA